MKLEHFKVGFKFIYKDKYFNDAGEVMEITEDSMKINWNRANMKLSYPINKQIKYWINCHFITPISFIDDGLICKKSK